MEHFQEILTRFLYSRVLYLSEIHKHLWKRVHGVRQEFWSPVLLICRIGTLGNTAGIWNPCSHRLVFKLLTLERGMDLITSILSSTMQKYASDFVFLCSVQPSFKEYNHFKNEENIFFPILIDIFTGLCYMAFSLSKNQDLDLCTSSSILPGIPFFLSHFLSSSSIYTLKGIYLFNLITT